MKASRTFGKIFLFAILSLFAAAAVSGPAVANANDCHTQKRWYYKTVTKYEYKSVPYQLRVKYHKPCGTPYYVWKTYYKTVKVAKTYRVKVYY